jgi:general secretion pathway protein F
MKFRELFNNALEDLFVNMKREMAVVFSQLSVYSETDIGLDKAIPEIVSTVKSNKLKRALAAIYHDVMDGVDIDKAFKRHAIFNQTILGMLSAGVESGDPDVAFKEIGEYCLEEYTYERQIASDTLIIKIAGLLLIAIFFGVVMKLLPLVETLLKNNAMELPWYAGLMMTIANLFAEYWPITLCCIGGLFYLIHYFKIKYPEKYDLLVLQTPVVGNVRKKLYMYRFAKAMYALRENGVDEIAAVEKAAGAMGNQYLKRIIFEALPIIQQGNDIAPSIKEVDTHGYFDPPLLNWLKAGQESGDIVSSLKRGAAFYQMEFKTANQEMTTLLQPLLYIPIGFLIFLIFASFYPAMLGIGEMLIK